GGRPTKRPSRAAAGCPRSCSPDAPSAFGAFGRSDAAMPMNVVYRGPSDLPPVVPVFPLVGALLLPRGQMPLNIFEPRYLAMIDDALADRHRLIGMIQPDDAHAGTPEKPNLYQVGCVGRITQFAESGDGRYLIQLTGVTRFRL